MFGYTPVDIGLELRYHFVVGDENGVGERKVENCASREGARASLG